MSAINQGLLGITDLVKYEDFKTSLNQRSAVAEFDLDRRWLHITQIVHRLEKKNALSSVFKGKWLEAIIVAELHREFSGKSIRLEGLGPKITATSIATLDFSSPWLQNQVAKLSDALTGSV